MRGAPKNNQKSKMAYEARMRQKEAKKRWQEQKAALMEARRMEIEVRGERAFRRRAAGRASLTPGTRCQCAQELKKKREEKRRRRLENEFKSSITQVVRGHSGNQCRTYRR